MKKVELEEKKVETVVTQVYDGRNNSHGTNVIGRKLD